MSREQRRSIGPLLLSLRSRGVRLWIEDDRVRYRAPASAVTTAEFAQLQAHRDEVREILERSCRDCGSYLYFLDSHQAGLCVTCRTKADPAGVADELAIAGQVTSHGVAR